MRGVMKTTLLHRIGVSCQFSEPTHTEIIAAIIKMCAESQICSQCRSLHAALGFVSRAAHLSVINMTGALQVCVLWWVSALGSQQTETPTANETAGRFFGGRWFPREGRICDAQLQALRCWHTASLKTTQCCGHLMLTAAQSKACTGLQRDKCMFVYVAV